MSGHSALGPSKAEQWINCPGSVELSKKCPKSPPNEYAAAGSVYHHLSEELLTGKIDELELLSLVGTTRKQEGFDVEITDEGVEGVLLYRDTITADLEALKASGKPAAVHQHVEAKVNVASVDPDVWGTADWFGYRKGDKLIVTDAKFGRGLVEVVKNRQLGIYVLGVMETFAGEVFDEVWVKIVQPLAHHAEGPVRMWRVPMDWLKKLREEARAAVQESRRPDARFKAGTHCKWCPAKMACPTRDAWVANGAKETAQADFEIVAPATKEAAKLEMPPVRGMSVEQLVKAYEWRDAIESWFSDVADRIQEMLAAGEKVPGWKLVDGRSNRKWVDESKVVETFGQDLGERLYEKKLLSPSKLEKLVGKSKKAEVDALTFKPEAKKAVARDTDPRPATASKAQDDFGLPVPPAAQLESKGIVETTLAGLEDEVKDAKKPNEPLWAL